MSIPVNHYVAGNPVGDSPAFVGRADILREVIRVLRRPQDNAIVLYGQRRIGKTSILQNLAVWLPRLGPYRPVYFDLQDKAALPLNRVLRELACTVAHALSRPDPDLGSDPETAFREEWLPTVLRRLPPGASLVLLLDEFDVLTDPQVEQAAKAFFPYLRGLLTSNPERLQFVFVIGRNVDDLTNIALSLFKGTPARRVSLLSREDTAELVRLSETDGALYWSEESVRKVWQLTRGHPFLTQQLCSYVWERAYDEEPDRPPTVAPEDVDAVVLEALEASRNTLEWLWDGLPPAERVVASALAEAGPDPITQEGLEQWLHESGVHVVIRELQNAPRLLQDWDLIEPADGGYCFRVELLRRWIARHKPLRRVQEELDHIEPVADSLYGAGLGLYRGGQLLQAIAPLRQAINLNPNHVGANQLLADILLARGQVEEARQLLERLYAYQPAAAHSRLVQALLAQARDNEDDDGRLALYDRVLQVDPAQPEAIAGRRDIWQRRGDAALEGGNLEAARGAYQEAGDADKVAHVEVLRRRQTLLALVARAKAHEQAQEWTEATATYEQLVAQAPDEESRTGWQAALERSRENAELARLFDVGISALRQGNRQTAQRALAEVVYRRSDYQRAGQRAAWLLTQAVSQEPVAVPWRKYKQLLPRAVILSAITAVLILLGGGWVVNTYYFQPREVAQRMQGTAQAAALLTAVRRTVAVQDAIGTTGAQTSVAALADQDATARAWGLALASTATADAVTMAATGTAQAATVRCRDSEVYELAVAPDPTLFPRPGTIHVVGSPNREVRATWVITNMGECPWAGVKLYPLAGGEPVSPTLWRGEEQMAQVGPGEQVELVVDFSIWAARGVDAEWVVAVNDMYLFDQPHLGLAVDRWLVLVTPTPTPAGTEPSTSIPASILLATPSPVPSTGTPEPTSG